MRVVPTGDEHKGGMVKDEQMTFPVNLLKTRNWTQRIIFKHLKPKKLGMLTLSAVVVLILVLIVLIVKALVCAV